MIGKGSSWATLLCSLLLLSGAAVATPASARVMDITVANSGLVVYGIPLPGGAVPSMVASVSLENLKALAPATPELGRGKLNAVVYEMPQAAPPDALAAFYRRTMSRPFALALPPQPGEGRKRSQDDGIRVMPFLSQSGYLAIQDDDVSRPSSVTVAMVEGAAQPADILGAVETLRKGGGADPTRQPSLLDDNAWEAQFTFTGPQVQILQRRLTPSEATGPLVDVMRVLLTHARAINFRSRAVAPVVPSREILTQFRDEARRSHWRLLSLEAEASRDVTALYRLVDDKGMVMLAAGPGQPVNAASPRSPAQALVNSTEITRLEVTGRINMGELFRPRPPRTPMLMSPSTGPLPPRRPFAAKPR